MAMIRHKMKSHLIITDNVRYLYALVFFVVLLNLIAWSHFLDQPYSLYVYIATIFMSFKLCCDFTVHKFASSKVQFLISFFFVNIFG